MPPNAAPLKDKKSLQTFLEQDLQAGKGMKLELQKVDGSHHGDLGFATGTWKLMDASGAVLDEGSWIEVRKKVGGEWKIYRDIWNSSRPMAK
jgi:ketosteroid isomerase-like protein